MSKKLQKLELTWIGKGEEPKLEPRILIEDPSKSYGDPQAENMLIYGDNLLALKALEQDYSESIKCIYIDPPYNTGSAFEHYDDGIEHSLWLNLLKPRLSILKNLLTEDGSIWISIDDNECHYLKVLCDEIFGRKNFNGNVIWQKIFAPKGTARGLSANHDHILCYSKNIDKWKRNLLPRTEKMDARYKNPDNDPRGNWAPDNLTARNYYGAGQYSITTPMGRIIEGPPKGTYWRVSKQKFDELDAENRIWWGDGKNNQPRLKRFLNDVMQGVVPETIWLQTEVGNTQEAKKEANSFVGIEDEIFETPKPERLLKRIIEIASNPGDIILDSFLGSGTTAAAAQKMNRRWIGVELGEHAITHCLPRLQQVVFGKDKGGISEAVNWNGGGGFKFYTLAPSLIQKDKYGSDIINPEYNANMLAAAMAKQEGFRYAPDEDAYWKQGNSSEKDFIYTTTQFITIQILDRLAEELKPGESLLICCKSFAKWCVNRHSNITIKKIPQMLLGRCEFGKDDYSLNIVNLPHNDQENEAAEIDVLDTFIVKTKTKKKKTGDDTQPSLFQ